MEAIGSKDSSISKARSHGLLVWATMPRTDAGFALDWDPMTRIAFDIDDGVLARLHRDPNDFTRELRIAAAVKWYEEELVSQGRAAEVAGVSRAEFVEALGRYGVTPFQDSLDELMQAARVPSNG